MKDWIISVLLKWLSYAPGTVCESGKRKYIVDVHGAYRRLGRE